MQKEIVEYANKQVETLDTLEYMRALNECLTVSIGKSIAILARPISNAILKARSGSEAPNEAAMDQNSDKLMGLFSRKYGI